jgi:AcrR family transcriptional regulator
MPRNARTEVASTTAADSARERVLAAAERCIERHGIRKTTIEDIASEAGMSRPGVYRYFSDRDDLLVALIYQHSRALHDKGHRMLASKTSLTEKITEGVLYLADHGRRDQFIRYMVNLDGTDVGRRMLTTHTSATLVGEFWDPILDDAIRAGALPEGLARPDIHLWLRSLSLMVMRGLDEGDGDVRRYRTILKTFVGPAFSA